MNYIIKCVRVLCLIALIVAIFMLPFAWVLRDGLGPNAIDSKGFAAVIKTLTFPWFTVPSLLFLVLRVLIIAYKRCQHRTEE